MDDRRLYRIRRSLFVGHRLTLVLVKTESARGSAPAREHGGERNTDATEGAEDTEGAYAVKISALTSSVFQWFRASHPDATSGGPQPRDKRPVRFLQI